MTAIVSENKSLWDDCMNQYGKSVKLAQMSLWLKQRIKIILSFYSISKSKKRKILVPLSIFDNSNFFVSNLTVRNTSKECLSINKIDDLSVLSIPSATRCKKYHEEQVGAFFACFFQLIWVVNSANLSQTLPKNLSFWQR